MSILMNSCIFWRIDLIHSLIPILSWGHSHLLFEAFAEITVIINTHHIRDLSHGIFSGFNELHSTLDTHFLNKLNRCQTSQCLQFLKEDWTADCQFLHQADHTNDNDWILIITRETKKYIKSLQKPNFYHKTAKYYPLPQSLLYNFAYEKPRNTELRC